MNGEGRKTWVGPFRHCLQATFRCLKLNNRHRVRSAKSTNQWKHIDLIIAVVRIVLCLLIIQQWRTSSWWSEWTQTLSFQKQWFAWNSTNCNLQSRHKCVLHWTLKYKNNHFWISLQNFIFFFADSFDYDWHGSKYWVFARRILIQTICKKLSARKKLVVRLQNCCCKENCTLNMVNLLHTTVLSNLSFYVGLSFISDLSFLQLYDNQKTMTSSPLKLSVLLSRKLLWCSTKNHVGKLSLNQ